MYAATELLLLNAGTSCCYDCCSPRYDDGGMSPCAFDYKVAIVVMLFIAQILHFTSVRIEVFFSFVVKHDTERRGSCQVYRPVLLVFYLQRPAFLPDGYHREVQYLLRLFLVQLKLHESW